MNKNRLNISFILGCSRSGTTILSKAISSCLNINYLYEPPLLYPLFYNLKEPNSNWKNIFESYLIEDFLINNINGRNFNFNPNDDTFIKNIFSEKRISDVFKESKRRRDIIKNLNKYKIYIKIPDLIFDKKFIQIYKKTKLIIIERGAVECINSLYEKKWYSNKNNAYFTSGNFIKNTQVPFFINNTNINLWNNLNEFEKCVYHYYQIKVGLRKVDTRYRVKYEELVLNPKKIIFKLLNDLKLQYSKNTLEIIKSIKIQKSSNKNIYTNKIRNDKIHEIYNKLISN